MNKERKLEPKTGFKFDMLMIDEDEIFETEEEADDALQLVQIEYYECPECNDKYEDEEDALECCEEE